MKKNKFKFLHLNKHRIAKLADINTAWGGTDTGYILDPDTNPIDTNTNYVDTNSILTDGVSDITDCYTGSDLTVTTSPLSKRCSDNVGTALCV